MALTTYTELKSSLADWLNRSDLTSVIPDFISLAEAQMEYVKNLPYSVSYSKSTEILNEYDFRSPASSIPDLIKLRGRISEIEDEFWLADIKMDAQ